MPSMRVPGSQRSMASPLPPGACAAATECRASSASAANTVVNRTMEVPCRLSPRPKLHGVRGLVARQRTREVRLDLLLRLAAILVGELHADARGALALGAFGRQPDHASRHRQLLVLAHEVQQHEHLVAEAVVAVG